MKFFSLLLYACTMLTGVCLSQEVEPHSTDPVTSIDLEDSFNLHLTEFRINNSTNVHDLPSDLQALLDRSEPNDLLEVIATHRLFFSVGSECSMQVGEINALPIAETSIPGRGQVNQWQRQSFGTLVRVKANQLDDRIVLQLTYESTRLDSNPDRSTDRKVNTDSTSFQINTTLVLKPSATALVGGTSANASTLLWINLKPQPTSAGASDSQD